MEVGGAALPSTPSNPPEECHVSSTLGLVALEVLTPKEEFFHFGKKKNRNPIGYMAMTAAWSLWSPHAKTKR